MSKITIIYNYINPKTKYREAVEVESYWVPRLDELVDIGFVSTETRGRVLIFGRVTEIMWKIRGGEEPTVNIELT